MAATVLALVAAADPPAGDAAEVIEALVELEGPPVIPLWAQARRGVGAAAASAEAVAARVAVAQRARLRQAQAALAPALTAPEIGARVAFTYQLTLNGIAVRVRRDHLSAIAAVPGVRAVSELPPVSVTNFSSVPLIGAPAVWSGGAAGATGAGVKVGVIDSGIDYIHRDFGGTGDYQGQDYDDAVVPWTTKVVGGWDFVGDDPDPMDECNGHGTHVAGTVAGYGVAADGSTYSGPYGQTTDFASLRIGPGVAPEAQLFALRTGNCQGLHSLAGVLAAIEWTVDPNDDGDLSDHLDIVNLSLAAAYGTADTPDARGLNNAAAAGVLAAAAADNRGDVHYILGTPASSTRALSVASSVDATAVAGAFRVDAPAAIAGTYAAGEAQFGPDLAVTGDLSGALLYPASNQNGCASFPAGTFTGKIALLDRGGCLFVAKVKNAQNAGAAGVLIVNNVAGMPPNMSGSDSSITIASMITTQAAGDAIKAALGGGAVTVTLTASLRNAFRSVDPAAVDTVSSFSSRGPRRGDSALKPDIAAPGDTVFSAAALKGDRGTSLSGTSMATPHMAGVMALLKQLHPAWTVEELKALAMNTAAHDLYLAANGTPPIHGPGRVGAGRVDVAVAAQANAVAFDDAGSGAVSVSFGTLEATGVHEWTRSVRVVNKGASAVTYQLAYRPLAEIPGAAIDSPGGTSVTVPAGGQATFPVRLRADASQLEHSHDPALTLVQSGGERSWISELGGLMILTPASGPALRVPVYAVVRPAAAMSASPAAITVGAATADLTLTLAGAGVATGTDFPAAVQSLVSLFELQHLDPPSSSPRASRLRAVGVATDYPARAATSGGLADSWIYFGVATQGDWSSPGEAAYFVDIDLDGDHIKEFLVSRGDASGVGASDAFLATLCPSSSSAGPCESVPLNGVSPTVRDTAVFNSNVLVLPARLGRIAAGGLTRFEYRVRVEALGDSDWTDWLTYDPAHPGVTFSGLDYVGQPALQPLYRDLPGTAIPVHVDMASLAANASQRVLLLHHHNRAGERVQVIEVAGATDVAVELAAAPDPVAPGGTLTYTATVRNLGTLDAGDVELTDRLPSGVSATAKAASQGSCSGSSTVTCELGALAGGGSATVTITVAPSAPGPLINAVSVSSAAADTAPGNNTAAVTSTVGSARASWLYRIPSVAHTTGTGGTVWRSDVAAVNDGAGAASLTLTYRPGGTPLVRQATLGAGATLEWPDILVSLFGLAASAKSSGALEITADAPLALTSRTFNQGASGTFGQSYPALTPARALPQGLAGILPQLAKTAAVRSNIGVQNLGGTSCTVGVRLFDAAGDQVGSTRTASVGAGAWYQLNDIFSLAGAGSQPLGYALVEPENDGCLLWAYASVIDEATGDPTTIPLLFDLPPGPYLVPSVAHTTGSGGTVWRSDVAAVNRSGGPAAITLTFASDTQTVTRDATLADGATVVWSDILVSLFGFAASAKVSGTVRIDADVPLAITSRTYNQGPNGTYGQFYPALAARDTVPAGKVGVLPQLKKNAATRTNVGVQNLGDAVCTVLVTLFGAPGAQLGNPKAITVPAGKWVQVNDVFAATGAGNQDLAYATVEVQTPGGRAWAYASVIDAATGDPTTVAVVVE